MDAEDPTTGDKVRQEKLAFRGDTVELSDADLERAKRFDAIETGEGDSPGDVPVEEANAEQLAAWIKREKPTIDEVVDRADGDPEKASKLLEAENLATGQQPRQGLEDRLLKVVNQEED